MQFAADPTASYCLGFAKPPRAFAIIRLAQNPFRFATAGPESRGRLRAWEMHRCPRVTAHRGKRTHPSVAREPRPLRVSKWLARISQQCCGATPSSGHLLIRSTFTHNFVPSTHSSQCHDTMTNKTDEVSAPGSLEASPGDRQGRNEKITAGEEAGPQGTLEVEQ